MLPVLAILGRPNVGKSTLFNRLTRSRGALVADRPGLTRDRQVGRAWIRVPHDDRACLVVDTGGLGGGDGEVAGLSAAQAMRAAGEADAALLLVDARAGLHPADEDIARRLRALGKPLLVAVNKSEGIDPAVAASEFHALGLGEPIAIAAAHGHGLARLEAAVAASLPAAEEPAGTEAGVRVAVVGRPNVGKSTLINRLVGEERVIAHDEPGTTRDSVHVPFAHDGERYTLIDTAGVRRRARVRDTVERLSVIKTLQAVEAAGVVIFLVDAREGATDQDASLLGLVLESGRGLVLAVNKWDGLAADERRLARDSVDRKLGFAGFAPVHFVSALHGSGVGDLMRSVRRAWSSATRRLPTPELTRILLEAVRRHAPPLVRGRRIKLRYAHQGGSNPPRVIVHGNQTGSVPASYRRYLANTFRRSLALEGTPLLVEFRTGANPYAGRGAGSG